MTKDPPLLCTSRTDHTPPFRQHRPSGAHPSGLHLMRGRGLPQAEQASVRENFRKRLVHFLYAALTKRLNKEHYDAIFDPSVILHQRLFKSAGSPWEGDSITLQADIIRAVQAWPGRS